MKNQELEQTDFGFGFPVAPKLVGEQPVAGDEHPAQAVEDRKRPPGKIIACKKSTIRKPPETDEEVDAKAQKERRVKLTDAGLRRVETWVLAEVVERIKSAAAKDKITERKLIADVLEKTFAQK
jgi:hypothetical protein